MVGPIGLEVRQVSNLGLLYMTGWPQPVPNLLLPTLSTVCCLTQTDFARQPANLMFICLESRAVATIKLPNHQKKVFVAPEGAV